METLKNYLLVGLAACLRVLWLMFRAKGSALHKAQLDLLSSLLDKQNEADSKAISQARKAYEASLKAYNDAKRS